MSRIYGGFHFRFDNEQGKETGGRIGDYVSANFLLPDAVLPLVRVEGLRNGAPLLRVHGRPGTVCELQASENLTVWEPVVRATAEVGGMAFLDSEARSRTMRFYRVVEE